LPRARIYLRLTDLGSSNYDLLRNVAAMTYLVPASGHSGSNVSQRWSPTGKASGDALGVHPGTSDST